MVGNFISGHFLVYWSQVRISYPRMVEELVNSVLVAHYSNWFFSKMFWVVYVIHVPVLVCCIVCSDLPESGIGS